VLGLARDGRGAERRLLQTLVTAAAVAISRGTRDEASGRIGRRNRCWITRGLLDWLEPNKIPIGNSFARQLGSRFIVDRREGLNGSRSYDCRRQNRWLPKDQILLCCYAARHCCCYLLYTCRILILIRCVARYRSTNVSSLAVSGGRSSQQPNSLGGSNNGPRKKGEEEDGPSIIGGHGNVAGKRRAIL
jgi:hypothetical protein